MARDFAFKDAKQKINIIKNVDKDLNKASDYQNIKIKEIVSAFNSLNVGNYFSKLARDEIDGKPFVGFSDSFKKLILLMNQYISSNDLVIHAKELKNQINNDTNTDIKSLGSGTNPLSWLFTSRKKKQAASEAYQKISDYVESYIIEDSNNTVSEINRLNNIDIDSSFEDYNNSKRKYETLIKKIIKDQDSRSKLSNIDALLAEYQLLFNKIVKINNSDAEDKASIKKSVEYLVGTELLAVLRGIPIEEVNREKKGIRVKPLREAGYSNMAEVFSASPYNLAAVYGISQDIAFTVKRIADGYAQRARKDLKIKLSYDDKSKAATDVVKKIYVYILKQKKLVEIKEAKRRYDSFITQATDVLNEVGSGRFWAFYDDGYKQRVKDYYNNFGSIVYGDFGKTVKESYDSYMGYNPNAATDKAWEDFKINSIAYYNVIEEVCPGVLGNSDSMYGLPEDLAREIQDEVIYPDGLLCTLRRYQEWGVKYILHQEKVLLGDEMGLGKTIQAIATMVSLKNTGATHFAVICPASVVANWCREISKHSKLRVLKAHGSGKGSVIATWERIGGVVVTNYESTRAFMLDPTFRFSLLVVDEAHYIKNKGAARTARTIQLSKHADRLLFMTGTALENKVDEMISLIDVLRPNIADQVKNIAFMSSAPQFRQKIAPVYYRRKRTDVLTELPDLIESEEWCTMTPEEEYAYEEAVLSKNHMAARRVSWNVQDIKFSSKMNRLKEIIEDAKNDDRKVLVFSFFLDTIAKIQESLGTQVCLNPINGSVNVNRRQEIIDEFEKAPAGTVLCAQIQSGGTGLNIQAASVVIICEPQVKPSIENQAISRAYRMGQSRNVQVFRLLCENSIDEKMLAVLAKKQAEFDAFADKSVAAEQVQIDDTTLGDIIKEEIDRINKKRATNPKQYEETKPVEEWEKAKETYKGLPVSVTQRISMVSQPYGGYINPKEMEVTVYKSNNELNPIENIYPNLVGIAVDYLTRYMLEKDSYKAFDISIKGAIRVGEIDKAKRLLSNVLGLDDTSIRAAIKLSGFDSAFRAGLQAYKPVDEIDPDTYTISNVREMVNRSLEFFKNNGPVVMFEYTFDGAYTNVIGAGDGDFMTRDTLWDFKVSKNEPKNDYTFQLLVYYIMGLHSKYPEYKQMKYLGIYNPRLNKKYIYPVSKIDSKTVKRIEEEVIGY